MFKNFDLAKGAKIWMEVNGVKAGMEVLIVTDTTPMLQCGEALARAAQEAGAEVVVAIMSPRKYDNADPPRSVVEAIKGADLVVPAARYNILHSTGVEAIRAARGQSQNFAGALTEGRDQGLSEFHTTSEDIRQVKERQRKIVEFLKDKEIVHITSPGGTDLTLSVKGRPFSGAGGRNVLHKIDETVFSKYSLLPDLFASGEAPCAPVQGSANGTYVVDAGCYMGGIGRVRDPITWTIKDGRVVKISGGADAERLKQIVQMSDENAVNVAELAFGISHVIQVPSGNTRDKAILGGMHLAIGQSIGMLGGTVVSELHEDGVSLNITVTADGQLMMKDGKLLI